MNENGVIWIYGSWEGEKELVLDTHFRSFELHPDGEESPTAKLNNTTSMGHDLLRYIFLLNRIFG